MKKALSIVFVCLLVLATQRASGQEVVAPLDISNNYPSPSGWNYNSATVGTCCARPTITEPQNYYDILPNGSNRHSYTVTPGGLVRGLMSVLDDTENCDSLQNKVINYSGAGEMQQCYDSAKKFIETCYNNWYAPYMFTYLNGAFQALARNDTALWCEYQSWLESVLYLNTTNPEYFCQCVESFIICPHIDTGGEKQGWKQLNKSLAILRWLIQNTTCDTPFLQNEFGGARASQYSSWLNDTTIPLDTTIPPLDSVQPGLKKLLEKHFLYATVSGTPPPSIISNATANPNPASEGTVISFGISKEAYVKIELFDLLGHEVSGVNFESLFEPGNKSVPISLAGLAPGTYYARILTAYGEVQTVKLVKE